MNELLGKIENTAVLLYQNKEEEGIAETKRLIQQFQNIIQGMTEEQLSGGGKFAFVMLKELVENYQQQDMLGMADCLMEKSVLFVRFLNETDK